MSFKDAGVFAQPDTPVPDHLRHGGADIKAGFAVRHPNFRLRPPGQEQSVCEVSQGDITPLRLFPKGLGAVKLPSSSSEVSMGLEIEVVALDNRTGKPKSLYGRDRAVKTNGAVHIELREPAWDLDAVGLSPEGLAIQAEVATQPTTSWQAMETEVRRLFGPIVAAAEQKGYALLAAGLSGAALHPDWSNISPHPYIERIMTHGLAGTGTDFDANTVQAHVDLTPFGASIVHALAIGDVFNSTLATMLNAISGAAPFWKGQDTGFQSNREFARRRLSTKGGVQGQIPINETLLLETGDHKVRSGQIPVPERAFGSHNDFRPKLSTGTAEFGSMDSGPNVDLWIAQAVLLRQFTMRVTEALASGDPLPSFLIGNTDTIRQKNRSVTAKNGKHAELETPAGKLTVTTAWQHFFIWAKPPESDPEWDRAQETVMRVLDQPAPSAESYFDPKSPHYMRGTASEVMSNEAAHHQGQIEEIIAQVNLAMATGFMGLFKNSAV